jgi:hypothetical protein
MIQVIQTSNSTQDKFSFVYSFNVTASFEKINTFEAYLGHDVLVK